MLAPARLAALQALRRLSVPGGDLATALDHSRRTLDDDRDRALAADIILGTLRWRGELDHAVAWAGHRAIGDFDGLVLDLLRMSAYQLLHLDRVPAAAVVDDAVSLCKQHGYRSAAGAVNAILRRISRSHTRLPFPDATDPVAFLSVTWSHPSWLAERWIARMGFDTALAWARFNNTPAALTLCANTRRVSRDALAAALSGAGVDTRACAYAPDGLVVCGGNPLRTTLAREGAFFVQDEASQVVGAFAAALVAPGRVVDACAAPGGKTVQLAASVGEGGLLIAGDVRARRVRLLRETLRRGGITNVAIVQHDLLQGAPFRPVIDTMLIDAPCSGLGTIRRDPDIRWARTAEELPGYASRQAQLLRSGATAIRAGGCLVYSTCSSEPDENDVVVEDFLRTRPEFVLEDPRRAGLALPDGVAACLDEAGCLRTSPSRHGLEAFFAVRLRRRA